MTAILTSIETGGDVNHNEANKPTCLPLYPPIPKTSATPAGTAAETEISWAQSAAPPEPLLNAS